ncbi:helix-turn-helix domain-containing protein [Metabacillus litoralis]|uniref:helix-turn-helix domain-containing protein n=1 Tax=Metabacillus litoralis TaxID=152268 RepID=UPI00255A1669|nr:helix-turn-helix transcriptional regulator [Metabacillus litoralis]
MSLGKRLKSERERRNYSQKFVAEKIGITNAVLSNYERDYRDPDTETLKKLAELYDVTTDFLLGRTDIPNAKEAISSAFHDFDNITEEEKEYLDEQLEIFRKFRRETLDKKNNKDK